VGTCASRHRLGTVSRRWRLMQCFLVGVVGGVVLSGVWVWGEEPSGASSFADSASSCAKLWATSWRTAFEERVRMRELVSEKIYRRAEGRAERAKLSTQASTRQ